MLHTQPRVKPVPPSSSVPRSSLLLAALMLTFSLSACNGSAPKLSTLAADAQQACVQVKPLLTAASVVPDTRVASIISHANAVCGPLAVGTVPPTVDSNTPQWLGQIGGMLKVLAPLALSLL